jgi:hypothetical protein
MQYLCKRLCTAGYLAVSEGGGGRGHERRFVAINPAIKGAIKGAQKGAMDCTDTQERVHERVHERVQSPPTPPVVNVNVQESAKEKTENTPPKPPKPKPEPYRDGFDVFWAAYPRHDKRKDAEAIWSRLKPDADLLTRMLEAIDRQGLAAKEPQYRPMPTTWLNGERWKDESGPAAMNGVSPPQDRATWDPYGSWGKPKGAQS